MDIQKMLDMMSEAGRVERGNYHLTLGKLTEELRGLDPALHVRFDRGAPVGKEHSYRGYYSDLSFDDGESPVTVAELLAQCIAANGSTYEGYKGGDFTMGDDTPLWNASYGCCGDAIVDCEAVPGAVILRTKTIDR